MSASRLAGAVLSTVCFASAQQAIATVYGPVVGGQTGILVAAARDMDGDGVPDFLVNSPFAGPLGAGIVQIVSGASRTTRTIVNPGSGTLGGGFLFSTGDMNLDGVRDFVVNRGNDLLAFSGANGALLWQTSQPSSIAFTAAATIDDLDNDGRADLVVGVYSSSHDYLWTLRGSDGTQLQSSGWVGHTSSIANLGDIDGDGKPEFATNGAVYHAAPLAFLVGLPGGDRVAAANMAGDARNEALVANGSQVFVCSATSGAVLRTFNGAANATFAVLGDLDADGVPDLALRANPGTPGDAVEIVSGRTGALLSRWLGTTRFRCVNLAAIGDVNCGHFRRPGDRG